MASKAMWEVDPETRSKLHAISQQSKNNICCDCNAPSPQWASPKFGIFICLSCAGVHRGLGVHISFVRSISMDAFKAVEIERMRLGGNEGWRNFFENHEDTKMRGLTWDDATIAERYSGEAGEEWKERLSAKVEGREYVPGDKKPAAAKPAATAAARSNTPLGGSRTASPSMSSGSGGGAGGKVKVDDKYFARLGADNAMRPDDLHPSQGGKYAGFGNTPGPTKQNDNQAMPGFDELQKDPVAALTKGFGWFTSTVTKTAKTVNNDFIHVKFEDGQEQSYSRAMGFGQGENEGTKAVRFELLWRDYMRLCTMKFGSRLFKLDGFKGASGKYDKKWKTALKEEAEADQDPSPEELGDIIERFLRGTTGMGLIDASQRELYHTGYTSNRARQNVASFFAKHLGIDWRYGAEWYEAMLVDYDVSSNWANWQYVAGVGNDPRGDARIFNPIKQAFDYDNNGRYVRTWVPEVKDIERLENAFQVWTTGDDELIKYGIIDDIMVTHPIKRIDFQVDRKPRGPRRPYRWRRGGPGRGGRRGGGPGNGSGDYNDSRRSYHNGPPSPESDRQFYHGGELYMQNGGQPRNGWSQRGNQTSWRGNSNGHGPNNHGPSSGRGGHMAPFRGNGFQRGFNTNYFNAPPPRQYMTNPNWPPQQFPPEAYHHQLPPHLGPHV